MNGAEKREHALAMLSHLDGERPAPRDSNMSPFAEVGEKITALLKQSGDARLNAALLLVQVKQRIKDGETYGALSDTIRDQFKHFCRHHVGNLSDHEVNRLLRIGAAGDPAETLAKEREKARLGMQARRARTNVSPVQRQRSP
jgi:hypothetical protein